MIKKFQELKLIGVFGNNDVDITGIMNSFNDIGDKISGETYEMEIDGLLFVVYHGTRQEANNTMIHSGKYDIMVCGHTHRMKNIRVGRTLVVNPGTADGWFFGFGATLAILDTQRQLAEFFRI